MTTTTAKPKFSEFVRRAFQPPIRDKPFWIVQTLILVIVVLHYFVDTQQSLVGSAFPAGVPVTLLVIPIGYAALRYGLTGSLATMVWTMLLWLPDLMLPHDEGHVGDDLLNLTIVLVVAYIFGSRVEAARRIQAQADEAGALALAVEVGYRRLFESNRAPIIVLDQDGVVSDANPAAKELFGYDVVHQRGSVVTGDAAEVETLSGTVTTLSNGHDYRLDVVVLPLVATNQRRQITFEDVTAERSEERRARHFAHHMMQVEEDQRRRLSRELHDEPLQLFLHLARRLEVLSLSPGVPAPVAANLDETRNQALDAAARLRTLARDLRPPALDQLGLIPALTSLVADVDDEGLRTQLTVNGEVRRLHSDVELGAFRVVQESLRNAVRHARASAVSVTITFESTLVRLRVCDDGLGFDPHADVSLEGHSESLGLVGMRERTRLLGGSLDVRSAPQHGTIVEATIPLNPPRDL